MTHLLDVNALLALGHAGHVHHDRVARWVKDLPTTDELATCSLTELGFVRIAPQARLSPDVASARAVLLRMAGAKRPRFRRLVDDLGVESLPSWVRSPAHTTDGHLLALAQARSARLATLDEGIPGSFLIPV